MTKAVSSYDDDGDSKYEEESNDTNEQDTLLPTQLATSNERVDTDSETDSDSEHEEEFFNVWNQGVLCGHLLMYLYGVNTNIFVIHL